MKTVQNAIRQQIDQLHFLDALALLDSICDREKSAQDWFSTGVCHAAIYATRQAEQDFFRVLELAPRSELSVRARLRLVQLYTQSGQLEKADRMYRRLMQDSSAEPGICRLFYGALLFYEKGDLDRALDCALRLAQSKEPAGSAVEKLRCESWTLAGDLYSAKGSLSEALACYGQALRLLACWPDNWRPLRKALILNSLADVYEQFEYFKEAGGVYRQAWKSIQEVDDPDIYDLSGYKLEILLSMANFHALQDELRQAQAILEEARPLAESMPMPTALYWRSRVSYIGGLCELYSENPRYDPFDKLFAAWKLQEEFLRLSTASSREYLGRTAYYAAYCYNPEKAQGISQKFLYEKALALFTQCSFKDPKFFLFCIASVENELGTLERRDSLLQAETLYSRSIRDFQHYLARWPEDMLAQTSLLAVLLNLFGILEEDTLEGCASDLLDLFEKTLKTVLQDPESRAQGEDAAARLLENDSLYSCAPQRLEAIHALLPDVVYS